LGTGRCVNFTTDQFMSDPLQVNLLGFIEKYQAKPAHVNTTMYLDMIENPVECQKLLWNISEEGKETKGICLWAQTYRSPLGYVIMLRLEE